MEQSHEKTAIATVILIVIAGLAAAATWWGMKEPAEEVREETTLEIPSVNPIEQTNPFSDRVYKNPFE